MPESLLLQHFRNKQFGEFLDNLPDQHDRDVAGMTMAWIKETYPEVAKVLNGELVWQHKEGRLKGE